MRNLRRARNLMGKSQLEARFFLIWRGVAPNDVPNPVEQYRFHPTRKLNAAAELGWRVLRYSGAMLDAPQQVVEQIVEALSYEPT